MVPAYQQGLHSLSKITSPRPHPVNTSSQSYTHATGDLLMSAARFCLILMLSLYPKVNIGCMLHVCLLNAHAPSILMKSPKFSCLFPQYVCNPNPYNDKKLTLTSVRGDRLEPTLVSLLGCFAMNLSLCKRPVLLCLAFGFAQANELFSVW